MSLENIIKDVEAAQKRADESYARLMATLDERAQILKEIADLTDKINSEMLEMQDPLKGDQE